jgi:glycosyltransferase involved in cell wall biosynthesis
MSAVSILMPSYNHGRFLPETLRSLLDQTFRDWELIAVDDGSIDDSVAVLHGASDSRVKVFRNERNLGTYGTLSRALSEATSELVAVLDSDDRWSPRKLALQVQMLQDHPEFGACYTAGRAFGAETPETDLHGDWPRSASQELLPFLLEENRVLASSVMFRKQGLRFDPSLRYAGDWAVLLGTAKRAPIGYVAEPLTGWRQHDNNTFVRSAGQVAEEIRLRQSILAAAEVWQVRQIPQADINTGLSRCALHLSALLALQGRMGESRAAARHALKLRPSVAALKRLTVVSSRKDVARARLWPGSPPLETGPNSPLVEFV